MPSERFFITTPIYYVNDLPHIGHAYTTIAADVLARHHRQRGERVFFLTGTDEHGQKVQQAADRRGVPPQQHVDELVVRFRDLWQQLDISHDDFIRTTEPRHRQAVQRALQALYERGEIYKASYEGWYCLPDERFWTEKELVGGNCPECGRPVEQVSEENYFFKMGKYRDWLRAHIREHPRFILPESRRNEILGFLGRPLGDLCISRPKNRLAWGIPLPFDPEYVTYVWCDALVNYLTAPGYPDPAFTRWWPADCHLVGKDILTTHAIYWSTMLKAMELPLPVTLFAHGWWTVKGEKMSKSRGNVVDPWAVIAEVGVDAFRYFLLREVPFGLDGDYSREALLLRYHSDLANDLGNLLSRLLTMVEKYQQGLLSPPGEPDTESDGVLRGSAEGLAGQVQTALDEFAFHRALQAIWEVVGEANRYVERSAPWALAKDPALRGRLAAVLYSSAAALRLVAVSLAPFLPRTAEAIWSQLGIEGSPLTATLQSAGRWEDLRPGTRVLPGRQLFPRILPEREAL